MCSPHAVGAVSFTDIQSNTVCTLSFAVFNVHGFHGLAAIHKSFVHKNLDINAASLDTHGTTAGIHKFNNAKFVNTENQQNRNSAKLKCIR